MLNNFLNNFPIVFEKTTRLHNQISKVFINYYSLAKIWDINFLQRNNVPSNFVENLHGNTFLLFTFIQLKDYWNFTYTDMYKMGFWNSVYWKWGLYKMIVFKFWAVKNSISFLSFLVLLEFTTVFSKSLFSKTISNHLLLKPWLFQCNTKLEEKTHFSTIWQSYY